MTYIKSEKKAEMLLDDPMKTDKPKINLVISKNNKNAIPDMLAKEFFALLIEEIQDLKKTGREWVDFPLASYSLFDLFRVELKNENIADLVVTNDGVTYELILPNAKISKEPQFKTFADETLLIHTKYMMELI